MYEIKRSEKKRNHKNTGVKKDIFIYILYVYCVLSKLL